MEITSHLDQGLLEEKFHHKLTLVKASNLKYARFWVGMLFVFSLLFTLYLYTPLFRIIN
jgi:hypothetical protein